MGFKRVLNSRIAAVGAGAAVLAVLAGGVGYAAGEITSNDIQDNTIRSADVKDESLKLKDLANGAQNQLKGEQGPAGPKGETGEQGPAGTDGTNAEVRPAAGAGYAGFPEGNPHHDLWAPNSYGETVQVCHEGEVVTGGGFSQMGGADDLGGTTSGVEILVSAPYTADYQPISETDSRFNADRWIVRGYNGTDQPVDVRAWVLCAPAN